MKPILVLGIGNLLKRDDGAGSAVVRFLEEHPERLGSDVELVDGGIAGHSLLPLLQGREKIIIVDAMLSNSNVGQVRRLRLNDIKEPAAPFSLHAAGIHALVRGLRLMGETPDIEIVAVCVNDVHSMKMELSPAVAQAVPIAAEEVLTALKGTIAKESYAA